MRRRRSQPSGGPPRRPLWLLLLPAVALSAPPATGGSQPAFRATADAGAAAVRQRGDSTVIAPTIAGELDVRSRRSVARLTLASTLATANRWSAQGDLILSHFAGRYASPWELGGSASTLRFLDEGPTTQFTGFARRHLDRILWGAWGGASAGATVRRYWRAPIVALEGGAWTRRGPLQLSVGLVTQRAHLDSSPAYDFGNVVPLAPVPGNGGVTVSRPPSALPSPAVTQRPGFDIETLIATDVSGLATWRSSRLELSASVIARHAPAQSTRLLGSTFASIAWWAQPSLALTTSGGALAADPIRNVPAARFLTLGARWRPTPAALARSRPPQAGPPDPNVPGTASARATADVIARDTLRVLRITAPGASTVEVRGDATEWRPIPLDRRGRHWELLLPIPPGTQRLLLRIDGGPWAAPGNLPTVEDDFGTRVGLVVVP